MGLSADSSGGFLVEPLESAQDLDSLRGLGTGEQIRPY